MKDNIEKIYMGVDKFHKNNKYMKLLIIVYSESCTIKVLIHPKKEKI